MFFNNSCFKSAYDPTIATLIGEPRYRYIMNHIELLSRTKVSAVVGLHNTVKSPYFTWPEKSRLNSCHRAEYLESAPQCVTANYDLQSLNF